MSQINKVVLLLNRKLICLKFFIWVSFPKQAFKHMLNCSQSVFSKLPNGFLYACSIDAWILLGIGLSFNDSCNFYLCQINFRCLVCRTSLLQAFVGENMCRWQRWVLITIISFGYRSEGKWFFSRCRAIDSMESRCLLSPPGNRLIGFIYLLVLYITCVKFLISFIDSGFF